MKRTVIVALVIAGALVFVAGMGVGNWILDRRAADPPRELDVLPPGSDREEGAPQDGAPGEERDGRGDDGLAGVPLEETLDGTAEERTGRCGRPPASRGPASDPDNDGISTVVEANPANADRCLDPVLENDDPSRPLGEWARGKLDGGLNLPDAPEGAGYFHDPNTDATDSDDWATGEMIATIESAGACWDRFRQRHRPGHGRITVLDLSLDGGGRWSDHQSHQNGLDADIRYVRRDGREARINIGAAPGQHDDEASIELINCFVSGPHPVELVFVDRAFWGTFDDWTPGRVIRGIGGHRDHFHVRLRTPERTGPMARLGRTIGRAMAAAVGTALEAAGGVARSARFAASALPLLARLAPAPLEAAQQQTMTRAPAAAQQQEVQLSVAARVQQSTDLQVADLRTGRSAVIYRADDAVIRDVALAPSERRVAFLEVARAATSAPTAASPRLVIMDPDGQRVVRKPEPIQRFAWSPDPRRLAVAALQGESREGGMGFSPQALLVVDATSGQARRVATPAPAVDMAWGRHDGALYVKTIHEVNGARVFRIDPRTQRAEPTRLTSVHLSPSGQFTLHDGDEVEPRTAVFDARSGAAVALPPDLGTPVRWTGERGQLVVLERGDKVATGETTPSGIRRTRYVVREEVVYDLESRRVVSRSAPDSTGWTLARPIQLRQVRINPQLLQSRALIRPQLRVPVDTGG